MVYSENNIFDINSNQQNNLNNSMIEDSSTNKNLHENFSSNILNKNNKIKSKLFEFKTEKLKKNKNLININTKLKNNSLNFSFNHSNNYNLIEKNSVRKISQKPYKILDAPHLTDDFYLNLLDWSNKNDIAVGLENSVFLLSVNITNVHNLITYKDNDLNNFNKSVTSLIWNSTGTELAIGNNFGETEIWDSKINFFKFIFLVNQKKLSRILPGHTSRVGVIAWHNNILSTGINL